FSFSYPLQHPPSYASLVAYQGATVHVGMPLIWPLFQLSRRYDVLVLFFLQEHFHLLFFWGAKQSNERQ
ncbi:MAG: hypothetical protein ACPG9H_07735, partial [Candidatus Puniceispirillaceae bacterium]